MNKKGKRYFWYLFDEIAKSWVVIEFTPDANFYPNGLTAEQKYKSAKLYADYQKLKTSFFFIIKPK